MNELHQHFRSFPLLNKELVYGRSIAYNIHNNIFFTYTTINKYISWWRHQTELFSALLAICAGNSPVPGEFPAERPVTRSFDVFFELRLNKSLS